MIVSMTGFATKTLMLTGKDGSRTHLTITLKALNSRFLEATCKLPFALNHLETEFIKIFKKKLHRGHIMLTIHMTNPNVFKGPIEADIAIVKSYLQAIKAMQQECNIEGELTLAQVIALPNIFTIEEQTIDDETKKYIFDAVNSLVDQLIQTRTTEGTALQKDLENRITRMQHDIDLIEQTADRVMEKRKTEVQQRLSSLGSSEIAEAQRNALYLELDRIDIHEEIVRFKSHLETFKTHLTSPDQEKGRRLDFILQELARAIKKTRK